MFFINNASHFSLIIRISIIKDSFNGAIIFLLNSNIMYLIINTKGNICLLNYSSVMVFVKYQL